jgi:hypothetical protein
MALVCILIGVGSAQAFSETYTGSLNSDNPVFVHTFELRAGDTVLILANATSGNLDTFLSLADPDGIIVAENDDRDDVQLNSAVGHTATKSGAYTLTLSRYSDESSGGYRLSIETGDITLLDELDTHAEQVRLSGPALSLDTAHFRIHYTLSGADATTEEYVLEVAKVMEQVWQVEVHHMGWPAPPGDGRGGGDDRFDVYLVDMLDEDGFGALGSARPGEQYGDNPATAAVEQYATSTLIRLDNDFAELDDYGQTTGDLLRATAAHEFHHAIQHGYDMGDMLWYNEATSTWMETQVFPKVYDATGYVSYTYEYPELCFGTQNDPSGGLLMYGDWMFIQSLVDAHDQKLVFKMWSSVAQYEGFEGLKQTLAFYQDTIPNAFLRYRIQNIVRDYALAPQFEGATLWLAGDIGRVGRTSGYGVQELGANYIAFHPTPGTYRVNLLGNDSLELWAVGIRGGQADAIRLGSGGTISNADYEYMYLMVFNPAYDDDVNDCTSAQYSIETTAAGGTLAPVTQVWDARYFAPLHS